MRHRWRISWRGLAGQAERGCGLVCCAGGSGLDRTLTFADPADRRPATWNVVTSPRRPCTLLAHALLSTRRTVNNGIRMPQMGFGVFRIPSDQTDRAVLEAIECGYRSIDTASLYGNERGVGRAVAACGVPREELFVTTKLWNDDQGRARTAAAFESSLSRLG